ncbi:MAG: hypothetical protein H6569_10780 [Lewinellaceae bacterium]|nr:hypothetical protein [Lewinellaceae bacterium]
MAWDFRIAKPGRLFLKTPFGSLFLVSGFALLVFGFCYPTHFLVADELAYFEQARAFSAGQTCAIDYPPGTAILATFFIWFGGNQAVFWSSFTCWLAGTWALALTLHKTGKPVGWALYPWFFIPGLVFIRTLMSDMPSFALATVFGLLCTALSPNRKVLFSAGLVGGLGLLFRETNLLWVLPFALGIFFRKKTAWPWFWLGLLIGSLPRLIAGWALHQNPVFLRDPGIPFSWSALPGNLAFYALALSVILPGGLWFLWKSKNPYRVEIGSCVGLFLFVYGCYDYDALAKSGYKGILLQARFMLPLLPFFALLAAWTDLKFPRKTAVVFWVLACLLFASIQIAGRLYNAEQQKITTALLKIPFGLQISFSPDESPKYLNALYDPSTILDGHALSDQLLQSCNIWYAHLISRSESADREAKAKAALSAFYARFAGWDIDQIDQVVLADGTRLYVWRAQKKDNDEEKR